MVNWVCSGWRKQPLDKVGLISLLVSHSLFTEFSNQFPLCIYHRSEEKKNSCLRLVIRLIFGEKWAIENED